MENKSVIYYRVLHQMLWISTLGYAVQCMFHLQKADMKWTEMWLLLPLVAVSFIWYELSNKFWLYMLAQPVIFAMFITFGKGNEFGFVVAFLIGFFLQILEKKNKTLAINNPSWVMCAVFAVIYLLCIMTDRQVVMDIIPYMLMAYLIVTLLFMNEVGMNEFVRMRQNVTGVQYGQIRQGNKKIIQGVVALALIIFCFVGAFMDNSPIYALGAYIREVLVKLLSFLENMDFGIKEVVREEFEYDREVDGDAESIFKDLNNDGGIPDVVYYVIGSLLTIFLIIVLMKGIARLVKLLNERFKKKVKQELPEDVTEHDEVISIKPRSRKLFGTQAKTPGERVRKIYKKTVGRARKNRGMDVPDVSFTPSELEQESFGDSGFSGRTELHSIYEKARYSQGGVTEQEEKEIRRIITGN